MTNLEVKIMSVVASYSPGLAVKAKTSPAYQLLQLNNATQKFKNRNSLP